MLGNQGWVHLLIFRKRSLLNKKQFANLDQLAEECQKILKTEYSDKLDELYYLGGTSGGARPKIMTTIDNEEWNYKISGPTCRWS